MSTLYSLIGLAEGASEAEIRRVLAAERRTWVPRQNSNEPARRLQAEDRIRLLDNIEHTLLNASHRRVYDKSLALARRVPVAQAAERQPFVTLELLWHGGDRELQMVRRQLGVTQGGAIKLGHLVSLLIDHPQLAPQFRVGGSPHTYRDQLIRVAAASGARWRRE